MEEHFFPTPAVAGILSKNYVEARLHTDGKTNVERIKELQKKLAESVSNPIYVTYDPATDAPIGRYEGAAANEADRKSFIEFLESATQRAPDHPGQ